MGTTTQDFYHNQDSQYNTFLFDFPTRINLNMKNQIKNEILVFPWDIDGYIKLNDKARDKIIKLLISSHRFKSDIARSLTVPDYWFYNFVRTQKIDTITFKKIIDKTNEKDLVNEILQFNDDKGSSSIPFTGKFPIEYSPLWHFVFCLSIGDGHIKHGNKKQFYWYQKPKGMIALINLINKMGFIYAPAFSTCKRGICIPQLIRKIGSNVTGLKNSVDIKRHIIDVSSRLGREYEIALLMAFFLDESGMSKPTTSEITLHQEGNLFLLSLIGQLLEKFDVDYSRNKKGSKWNIRFKVKGVLKLNELFKSLNIYGVNLLHRQEIFDKKIEIANLSKKV